MVNQKGCFCLGVPDTQLTGGLQRGISRPCLLLLPCEPGMSCKSRQVGTSLGTFTKWLELVRHAGALDSTRRHMLTRKYSRTRLGSLLFALLISLAAAGQGAH